MEHNLEDFELVTIGIMAEFDSDGNMKVAKALGAFRPKAYPRATEPVEIQLRPDSRILHDGAIEGLRSALLMGLGQRLNGAPKIAVPEGTDRRVKV